MTAVTLWANWRIWRKQRTVVGDRPPLSTEAFAAALMERGVSAEVAAIVRELAGGYFYVRGATPRPEDSFDGVLCVGADEIEEIVETAFGRLGLAEPSGKDPEHIPALRTVADLALYLESRRKAASRG